MGVDGGQTFYLVLNAIKNKTKEVLLPPDAIMAQYYDQWEGPYGDESGHPDAWFKAALKAAPDDLPTRQLAANWALEHGKLAFAKEQADSALRIEEPDFGGIPPDKRKYGGSTVGHSLRGLVALWEKDWAEAEKNFQKVLDDSPMDFAANNNMALALVGQDDPAKRQRALDYAQVNYNLRQPTPTPIRPWAGSTSASASSTSAIVPRRGDQGEGRQRGRCRYEHLFGPRLSRRQHGQPRYGHLLGPRPSPSRTGLAGAGHA